MIEIVYNIFNKLYIKIGDEMYDILCIAKCYVNIYIAF